MYTNQDKIHLFGLPNSLLGDAAVTIMVTCLITWSVEAVRVPYDLSRRVVQPMGEPNIEPEHPRLRALFFLPLNPRAAPATRVCVLAPRQLGRHLMRGMLVGCVAIVVLVPQIVLLLRLVGHWNGQDWLFSDRWAPQVFKLIIGGGLGLFVTPLVDIFWLMRAGWLARRCARQHADGGEDVLGEGIELN